MPEFTNPAKLGDDTLVSIIKETISHLDACLAEGRKRGLIVTIDEKKAIGSSIENPLDVYNKTTESYQQKLMSIKLKSISQHKTY